MPYVHIGITGKGIGTISDEKGKFNLQLQEGLLLDTLTFSIIGYNIAFASISGLILGTGNIKMTQSVTQLKEVIVKGKKSKELLIFGRTKPTKLGTGSSGINSYGIGQEIGTTIKSDGGVYMVDAISFHHRWNSVDSILYRINIYSIKDQMPHTSILEKELFVWHIKEISE